MSFFTRRPAVNILRILWTLIIIWHEYGVFISSARNCAWPDAPLYPSNFEIDDPVKLTHVLLIADPHIDQCSHASRGPSPSWLTRLVVDLNLRKNWLASLQHKPDVIVFLGDMMDNGRHLMSDEEYETYYQRFKNIFKEERNVPQYFIPGNHDIGLDFSPSFSPHAYARYTSHFGVPNFEISLANHTLIMFDAPGYADENAKRHAQKKSVEEWVPMPGRSLQFMKKFASAKFHFTPDKNKNKNLISPFEATHTDPVILFSHIPLYRQDGKSCGPLRERGTLRPGAGHGYQNTLAKHASQRLVQALKPIAIFSGDDHDYCEYTHHFELLDPPHQFIPEISVRTISMSMNVRRPGFQLLSLTPVQLRDDDLPTYKSVPCLLPDQLRIYLNIYLPLLAASVIFVCLANTVSYLATGWRSPSGEKISSSLLSLSLSSSSSSIKSDDALNHEGSDKFCPDNASLTTLRSLPTPIIATHRSTRSRSSRGWRIFIPENQDQDQQPHPSLNYLKAFLYSFWSGRSSLNLQRQRRRRQGWLIATLRDIRDIAVFPLGAFMIITWVTT